MFGIESLSLRTFVEPVHYLYDSIMITKKCFYTLHAQLQLLLLLLQTKYLITITMFHRQLSKKIVVFFYRPSDCKIKKYRQTKRIWIEIEGAWMVIHTNNINLPSLAVLISYVWMQNDSLSIRQRATSFEFILKLTFSYLYDNISQSHTKHSWMILPYHCLYTS